MWLLRLGAVNAEDLSTLYDVRWKALELWTGEEGYSSVGNEPRGAANSSQLEETIEKFTIAAMGVTDACLVYLGIVYLRRALSHQSGLDYPLG